MPGNFRKIPPRPIKSGYQPPVTHKIEPRLPIPVKPAAQKSTPITPQLRPVAPVIRRSTNLTRLEQRTIRRDEVRKVMDQVQSRPRPSVLPGLPPRKVMPNNQPPVGIKISQSVARVTPQRAPTVPSAGQRVVTPVVTGLAALTALEINTNRAHPEIAAEVSSLQSDLSELKQLSSLNSIQSDMNNLDANITNISSLLESARSKGYRYQGDIDDSLTQVIYQWGSVRPQVANTITQKASMLQNSLVGLSPQVSRVNSLLSNPAPLKPLLQTLHSQVNSLLSEAQDTQRDIESNYDQVESQTLRLSSRLSQIHWALDQLAGARFSLQPGEDLIMAVANRWDKEGKEDPEGVLYLTTQRVIFERKEKVALKKVLFITTDSQLVQEVLIDQPISQIQSWNARNKGLFGHQDFAEVHFKDASLGKVSFHINGQEASYWAELFEKVRSGRIDDEKTSGAGVSFSELSKPLTQADLVTMQNDVNELVEETMLGDIRSELATLENDVTTMERKLADMRAGGYVIERNLEAEVTILTAQWERVKSNAAKTLELQARLLSEQMTLLQENLTRLLGMFDNLQAARPLYLQMKSTMASAEAQADAAQATILTQYDDYADEVQALIAHMEWVNWMLEAINTASFRLFANESGVAATEAVWLSSSGEPENGILFLTDQRLLWEDRVGTYELKLQVPIQQVLDVKKESQEGNEHEYLAFTFGSDAPYPLSRFQLALPVASDWLKMVGRARSGDYTQDRAVPLNQAELDRIKNAPQQCSKCGAAFTAPILRGQTEITCEYCGLVTRI